MRTVRDGARYKPSAAACASLPIFTVSKNLFPRTAPLPYFTGNGTYPWKQKRLGAPLGAEAGYMS